MRAAIEVGPYDPEWPERARAACAELRHALPGLFSTIEHIGSTAVPGLAAKPVIDLMAGTDDLAAVEGQEPTLAALGFHRFETGMTGRLFYRRDLAGRRTHHLHVVPADSFEDRNERLLRDHLRGHPEDAAAYGELKLALRTDDGTGSYTRKKTALIQRMVDAARDARGLPRVPVWEE